MMIDEDDQQFGYICQEIGRCLSDIDQHDGDDENARQVELARQMHTIAKTMLDKIVTGVNEFGGEDSKLIVLTGIQINMPMPFEDYFQPLSFTVRHKDGRIDDLLANVFR